MEVRVEVFKENESLKFFLERPFQGVFELPLENNKELIEGFLVEEEEATKIIERMVRANVMKLYDFKFIRND